MSSVNFNKTPLPFSNVSNIFNSKDNYRIGLVFLIGYLLTFFNKMKVLNVPKSTAFGVLFGIALICSFFY